jgi:hypothetical protein
MALKIHFGVCRHPSADKTPEVDANTIMNRHQQNRSKQNEPQRSEERAPQNFPSYRPMEIEYTLL